MIQFDEDIFGCKSKFEVRINLQNPQAIQTPDPDLRSRPIQTSRSRQIQTSQSRPMIQTPLFYVGWTFSFTKYWKVLLCTTKYYSSTTLYCKVLESTTLYATYYSSTTLYYKVRSWVISWILEKFGHPVPDLVPDRSRPVPDQFHGIQGPLPKKKNRSVRPAQNHLIQFKSYMKWLSWFQALRSRRAEKTFYESGRSRRPDHCGTIQTRLSTHAHLSDGLVQPPTSLESHVIQCYPNCNKKTIRSTTSTAWNAKNCTNQALCHHNPLWRYHFRKQQHHQFYTLYPNTPINQNSKQSSRFNTVNFLLFLVSVDFDLFRCFVGWKDLGFHVGFARNCLGQCFGNSHHGGTKMYLRRRVQGWKKALWHTDSKTSHCDVISMGTHFFLLFWGL